MTTKQIPQPPQASFMQQPYWNANDQIKLLGGDFEMLYNFVNSFGPAVDAARRVMQMNINEGIIKIRHVDENGNEVPETTIKEYYAKVKAWEEEVKKISAENAEAEKQSLKSDGDNASDSIGPGINSEIPAVEVPEEPQGQDADLSEVPRPIESDPVSQATAE